MNNHEKLVNLCEQVVEATPRVNEEVNECYCPFCGNIGYYSDDISNIIHESECAYLIAKTFLSPGKFVKSESPITSTKVTLDHGIEVTITYDGDDA